MGFDPERAALQAGRVMLARLRELAEQRASFAFETTLASRTFAPWIRSLTSAGYECDLVMVWLRSADLAIQRMHRRVSKGGHFVPPDVIRRRYERGISNFVNLYMPLAGRWRVYNNSGSEGPVLAARKWWGSEPEVFDDEVWSSIYETARGQEGQDDR